MSDGFLQAIYLTEKTGDDPHEVRDVAVTAGIGLTGDRYARRKAASAADGGPKGQVTLIEAEAVEAVRRDCDLALEPIDTRRNLLTRGVALNHLVNVVFRVGSVRMRGSELCEPCRYLESKTAAGMREALVHRGGLRARILDDGHLTVGDVITVEE